MNEVLGKTYGIEIKDGIISKIIRHFPILNLLYTKKVKIFVLRRTDMGEPVEAVFTITRLPVFWMKDVRMRFALSGDSACSNCLLGIYDLSTKCITTIIASMSMEYTIFPHQWYSKTIRRSDMN